MIKRALLRAISRIPGGLLAYIVARLMFEDQVYAAIGAASYVFGNWFNAVVVLIVITLTRIITHSVDFGYIAGAVFEVGVRVYVTLARLKNGDL